MKLKSLILVSTLALFAGYASTSLAAPDDGEVIGTPAPGSKFSKLHPGMYSKQVGDLIGQPNDQKTYMTGKAWIPFHMGGDNYRAEYHYKGEGTLTFAGGGVGDMGSLKLIRITVDPKESGYVH